MDRKRVLRVLIGEYNAQARAAVLNDCYLNRESASECRAAMASIADVILALGYVYLKDWAFELVEETMLGEEYSYHIREAL